MESIWHDLRYEARSLRKAPAFTAVVLVTLFLAVGATSAVFSVVRAVLLRPLPFPEPERLVWITEEAQVMGLDAALGSDFLQWKADNKVFEELAAFTPSEVNLGNGQFAWRVPGTRVSREFLAVLGIQPALGRAFTAEEDSPGGPAAVILSHSVWREDFGGKTDILNAKAIIDGQPVSVVGVMPADFDFPRGARIWRPLALNVAQETSRERVSLLRVIGRLRPGVDSVRASSDLGVIHERIAEQFPEMYGQIRIRLTPLSSQLVSDARSPLLLLFGAVVVLLLIACANLTALLLAQGTARRREMGLRAALGAGRARLMRQSFVQSLLLSFTGGLAGLLASPLLFGFLLSITPPEFPRIGETRVDVVVLAFSLGVCLLVSVLCGLAPALAASRANPSVLLPGKQEDGGRPLRLRSGLVVAEVALALVLLIGAGLLLHSLQRLAQVDSGLDPQNVLTLSVRLSTSDYPEQSDRRAYLDRLLGGLRSLPAVEAVGASNSLPLKGSPLTGPVEVEGPSPAASGDPRIVGWFGVTPGYFQALGMELLAGRDLLPWDRSDAPSVAVVNQTFARLFLGLEDPRGRRFRPEGADSWISVVGLVRDALNSGFDKEAEPEVYRPLSQLPGFHSFSVALRSSVQPSRLADLVREEALLINPNQPVYDLQTMEELVRMQGHPRHFVTLLLTSFSVPALGLAALGIYGLIAYSISCRTREIGIRISLGASPGEVIGLFVSRGLALVLIGLAIGSLASLAASQFVAGFLYRVSSSDPATLISVSLFFAAVGISSCYLAARRILKLDPWTILKCE